VPIMLVGI